MTEDQDAQAGAYTPFASFADWAPAFDTSTIDQFAALLNSDKASVDAAALEAAVRIATRYAAVDTGAIEGLYTVDRGFTKTIATEAAAWEAALKVHGEDVATSIEDALNSFEFVMDVVTGKSKISESWIRQLHEITTASQEFFTVYTAVGPQKQSLPKGVYKTMPNSPTNASTGKIHHYAPPQDTAAEMARFVDELRSAEFAAAHPVLQAAYAHYAFVCIHPFADGNGRVSRLLASIYLYRSPGVPLVIFADQKDSYIDALEAADAGNVSAFIAFIEQRCIDTIEIVRLHLRAGESPSPDESLAQLTRDLSGRGGLSHPEFDAIASRLRDLVREEFQRSGERLALPPGSHFTVSDPGNYVKAPTGFRSVSTGQLGVRVALDISLTVEIQQIDHFVVWPARQDSMGPDFTVASRDGTQRLDIYLRDVYPAETEVLRIKITGWVEHQVNALVAAFTRKVRTELAKKGYASPPTS